MTPYCSSEDVLISKKQFQRDALEATENWKPLHQLVS